MTGALVAVGQGRLSVSQIADILEARDTQAYPNNIFAPACGLFLTRVDYKESGRRGLSKNVLCIAPGAYSPGLIRVKFSKL